MTGLDDNVGRTSWSPVEAVLQGRPLGLPASVKEGARVSRPSTDGQAAEPATLSRIPGCLELGGARRQNLGESQRLPELGLGNPDEGTTQNPPSFL